MRLVFDDCWASGCDDPQTHVVKVKVTAHLGDDKPEVFDNETGYCLNHALYFAAWLPYCYPTQYELISITPPASEMFPDRS